MKKIFLILLIPLLEACSSYEHAVAIVDTNLYDQVDALLPIATIPKGEQCAISSNEKIGKLYTYRNIKCKNGLIGLIRIEELSSFSKFNTYN